MFATKYYHANDKQIVEVQLNNTGVFLLIKSVFRQNKIRLRATKIARG